MTTTYAILDVSPMVYEEIKARLLAEGYRHALTRDGDLDLDGIALRRSEHATPLIGVCPECKVPFFGHRPDCSAQRMKPTAHPVGCICQCCRTK